MATFFKFLEMMIVIFSDQVTLVNLASGYWLVKFLLLPLPHERLV
jgi:hypothetical protein